MAGQDCVAGDFPVWPTSPPVLRSILPNCSSSMPRHGGQPRAPAMTGWGGRRSIYSIAAIVGQQLLRSQTSLAHLIDHRVD